MMVEFLFYGPIVDSSAEVVLSKYYYLIITSKKLPASTLRWKRLGSVNFKIYPDLPAGRPVSDRRGRLVFFTKGFCLLFNASNEKFSKGGEHG